MAWGPIIVTGTVSTIQNNLTAALQTYQSSNPDSNPVSSSLAQIQAVIQWAGALAAGGSCGANPQVTITGHANPNNTPVSQQPNNQVTISIIDIST